MPKRQTKGSARLDRNHQTARFIEPMECLPVEEIPQAVAWTYELKLDGYRLEAITTGRKVLLYSRRGHDLTQRFDYVAHALESLPDETVIDGELVALDEQAPQTMSTDPCTASAVVSLASTRPPSARVTRNTACSRPSAGKTHSELL